MATAYPVDRSRLVKLTVPENRMLLPCAPHVRKLANRDRIGSSERFCGHSEVAPLTYTTAVHMPDWKQDKKHCRGESPPSETISAPCS